MIYFLIVPIYINYYYTDTAYNEYIGFTLSGPSIYCDISNSNGYSTVVSNLCVLP